MDQACYWDEESRSMKMRMFTQEEQIEIDERRAAGMSVEQHNAQLLAALLEIDVKSIRALREGDATRIASLEDQAVELRLQLRK